MNLEREKTNLTASPRRIARLARNFLDGYAPLPPVAGPVAAVCETLYRVMNVWACLYVPQRLHHRWETRRWLNQNLRWLTTADPRPLLWDGARQVEESW
jgi:hypothetical protein